MAPSKRRFGRMCTAVGKTWLAFCRHYALMQTLVPFPLFLLYGPPNQWRETRALSLGTRRSAPHGSCPPGPSHLPAGSPSRTRGCSPGRRTVYCAGGANSPDSPGVMPVPSKSLLHAVGGGGGRKGWTAEECCIRNVFSPVVVSPDDRRVMAIIVEAGVAALGPAPRPFPGRSGRGRHKYLLVGVGGHLYHPRRGMLHSAVTRLTDHACHKSRAVWGCIYGRVVVVGPCPGTPHRPLDMGQQWKA